MQRRRIGVAAAIVGGGALAAGSAAGSPLPGDPYRLVTADLVDRRSGTAELWHQEVDRDSSDRVGTFGALTTRGVEDWQTRIGTGTVGGEEGTRPQAQAFLDLETLWLWREPHEDGYGLGLAAGLDYDGSNNERRGHYLIAPWALEWGQRTTLHANIGAVHDRQIDDTGGFWGVGLDWRFTERWDVVLQVSGDMDGDSDEAAAVGVLEDSEERGALGLQRSMLDGLAELELTYGKVMSAGEPEAFYLGMSIDALRF